MAAALQMVAPATAPIDIHPPAHTPTIDPSLSSSLLSSSSSLSPPLLLALAESSADSGYESSWPSLSEAAAWSPPPGQKRQLLPDGSATATVPLRYHHSSSSSNSSNTNNNSNHKNSSKRNNYHQHQQHAQAHGHGQAQGGGQGIGTQQHQQQIQKSRQGKGQRRRVRTQAYQAKRMAQLQSTPLVDFGSPQLEDDDQSYGPVDPPIPLSVIPRGWLYEDDYAPSLAEDVLIALPKREWVYDSDGPMSMDAKSFVVMSWNILSPRLCHASRLDAGCEPAFLDWSYRKEAILNQIAFTDADIVCLQELELKDYEEYFNPHLSRLGFRSIHAYKMNVYEMRDGCAIFYRDSRFKLLSEHVLRFNQVELDDYNVKRPSMARDTAIRFNLFHNLAIVALFENRRTKRQVQVATTHLLADPAFPDAKMLQTAILTSKLEELKAEAVASLSPATTLPAGVSLGTSSPQQQQHQQHHHQQNQQNLHIPTILVGDFNSLPDSSVVEFLKMGQVETCHFGDNDFGRFTRAESKHFYHHLGLVDSYKASILPFTNATKRFQGTIDYLLYDPCSLGMVGFLDHLEPGPELAWAALPGPVVATGPSMATGPSKASTTAILAGAGSACGPVSSSSSNANMSSSDLDSELEVDMPSSVSSSAASSASSSTSSINTVIRAKGSNSRKNKRNSSLTTKKIPHLDFSKLFTNSTTSTTTAPAPTLKAIGQDEVETSVIRAPLPTALPSQYFPSDHIPLVAIFRERDYSPAAARLSAPALA